MAEQFNELFDRWADSYDDTVNGSDPEYQEVFRDYEKILDTIAARSEGFVLEFGVGTGNLTEKLIGKGLDVIGVEPSENMRQIAKMKLPEATILKGNFLSFPIPDKKVDTIVSSYAFHHLTDVEKEQAFAHYTEILNKRGKIIFGDTIFIDDLAKQEAYEQAQQHGFHRLAEDLNSEFYTTIPVLYRMLEKHGYIASFGKLNDFVWLLEAEWIG